MTKRWWTTLLAVLATIMLLASACGDDEGSDDGATDPVEQPAEPAEEEMASIDVSIADGMLDGLPDELQAGLVEVNFDAGDAEDAELDFSLVDPGLSEDDFRQGLSTLISGGPVPDEFQNNAGALPGTTTIELEPGEYYVWAEPPSDGAGEEGAEEEGAPEEGAPEEGAPEEGAPEEGAEDAGGEEEGTEEEGGPGEGPPPEIFLVSTLTVTGENPEAELPDDNAGQITAVDYAFDVDVAAGENFNFVNDGAEQLHHAIVFDFGTSDPAAVEPFFPTFVESEGEVDAPEGVEVPEGPPSAFSGVFGPGLRGTGQGSFEAGNTYVVTCFISDRAGGPPHAIGEGMYEVFTVDS